MKMKYLGQKIGKNMQHALDFFNKYPGLHTIDHKNKATLNAINSLERIGYLTVLRYSVLGKTTSIQAKRFEAND